MRRREQWVCTAKTQRAPPPPVGRHQINFTLSPPRHCDVIHSSVSPVAMATLPLGAANSLNPSLSRRVNVPPPSPDPSEPSPLAPPEGVQLHHAPTPNCPALCSLLPQCWCRRKEKKKKNEEEGTNTQKEAAPESPTCREHALESWWSKTGEHWSRLPITTAPAHNEKWTTRETPQSPEGSAWKTSCLDGSQLSHLHTMRSLNADAPENTDTHEHAHTRVCVMNS